MTNLNVVGNIVDNVNRPGKIIKLILVTIVILLVVFFIKKDAIMRVFIKEDIVSELTNDVAISESELISISSVKADSELTSSQGITYGAENIIDGNLATSWQEGSKDFGKNNVISLKFDDDTNISFLVIYNGNQISEEDYKNNNRLKEIEIILDTQKTKIILEDTMQPQIIKLIDADKSKTVSIKIKSVYEGSVYNDTCVSEIKCYK